MGKIFKALEKSHQNFEKGQSAVQKGAEAVQPENEDFPTETILNQYENASYTKLNINRNLITGLDPQSIESEQFRILKNNLLFPEKGSPPKCIMVTSASPGDGKSFIAANLAVSIAQGIDEHVLLMDCDLRKPSLHSIFGFDDQPGLSEYLSEARPLSSLLLRTFVNKLTILPAGKIPHNPSDILSSEQMRRLVLEAKQRYSDRYIIIDTPPPYLTSETNAISRQVDGVIIVIRYGKSTKKQVNDIIDFYGKDKILGAVFNLREKSMLLDYGKYSDNRYGNE